MFTEDAELIKENVCPVCRVKRRGVVDPRRALLQHLRSVKDGKHQLWRVQHYKRHFLHGGDYTSVPVTKDIVAAAVGTTFGQRWADIINASAN